MRRACLFVIFVVLASCLGRTHLLKDGTYHFTFADADIVKDSCSSASSFQGADGGTRVIGDGTLVVAGDTVRLRYPVYNTVLAGNYLAAVEKFSVDGSENNVTATINGAECLVDTATIHLEANTVSGDEFSGVVSVRYDTREPTTCNCELLLKYDAVRQGD